MARIRYIKPDISLDEELAITSLHARLLFRDLWCHCDREGRCEDRPMRLKALIFPWDSVCVSALLDELAPRFLVRYEVDGRRYIQVNNFAKHQRPHHTEQPSQIPAPPKRQSVKHGVSTVVQPSLPGRNGNGDGDGDGENSRPPAAADLKNELSKLVDNLGKSKLLKKTDDELLETRLPFTFGDIPKGRRIIDIAVTCAQKIMDTHDNLGADLRRALRARIDLKQSELHPKLRTA